MQPIRRRNKDTTLIILTGGSSVRFQDKIKAFEIYKGKSLLKHKFDTMKTHFPQIVVSVVNAEMKSLAKKEIHTKLSDDISVSFEIDQVPALGPMRAIHGIIPKIQTKYCIVTAIDNILVRPRDLLQLKSTLIENQVNTSAIIIAWDQIIATCMAFETKEIMLQLELISHLPTLNRLTDLFRISSKLALLEYEKEAQFLNINTPEELEYIENQIVEPAQLENIHILYPGYFPLIGTKCIDVNRELEIWSKSPLMVSRIIRNIKRDAEIMLNEKYGNCNFVV